MTILLDLMNALGYIVNMTLLLVHLLLLKTSIEMLLLGSECISSLLFTCCIHCIFLHFFVCKSGK